VWNVLQKCRLSAISLRLPVTKHSLLILHKARLAVLERLVQLGCRARRLA